MTVLLAGSFRTSDYRRPIPERIRMIALLNAILRWARGTHPADIELPNVIACIEDFKKALQVKAVDIDHRPPLSERDYDLDAKDFIPDQHDPRYLEALIDKQHDERTFGRRADAEKTVSTVGSDAYNRAHGKRIRDREALSKLKAEVKRGDPEAIAKLLKVERRQKPKRPWPKRPFLKRQRSAPTRIKSL